jgi:hypothetical protein
MLVNLAIIYLPQNILSDFSGAPATMAIMLAIAG